MIDGTREIVPAGIDAVANDNERGARLATEPAAFDAALNVLVQPQDVTAAFGVDDVMASGPLVVAPWWEPVVPGQLSVVGSDNPSLARTRLVDLTTVDDGCTVAGGLKGYGPMLSCT